MQLPQRTQEILQALKRNQAEDRLHHAYVFSGPTGVGKFDAAQRFAAFLFAGEGEEAMLERIRRSGHPDFSLFEPKDGLIRVESVRELSKILSYAPMEAARRVVVFKDAQSLNAQAANAILKVLEEPPAHTLFLLLVPDANLLLQTIRSRCQLVRFFPLAEQELLERFPRDANTAEALVAARWSEGSLERGQNFLDDSSLRETRQTAAEALLALWQASPRVPSKSLRALESLAGKEQALIALDTWYSLSRDLALCLAEGMSLGLYHEDSRESLGVLVQRVLKNKVSLGDVFRELGEKCALLHRLRVGFDFNANQKLALESALCGLQLFSIGKSE